MCIRDSSKAYRTEFIESRVWSGTLQGSKDFMRIIDLGLESIGWENSDCSKVLASEVRHIWHESGGFEGLITGSKALKIKV